MRILIASDLHGSTSALRFLLEREAALKPDLLVLLGDLVYHGPRNPLPSGYDTLSLLAEMPELENLSVPVTAVRGNCDAEVDVALLPFSMPESAWIDADGLQIFASHGHRLPDSPPLPGIKPGMVVLRGHTHIPRGETVDGIHIWNPGSLSLPKGGSPKTYGLYSDGCFQVFDMAGNVFLEHRP